MAAGHIETVRNGGPPIRPPARNSPPLRMAFTVSGDGSEFDDLLQEIDAITAD